MPNPSVTSSPPDSGFTPRKEFIRDHAQPNSFAILALSSSNFLRLYSFPQTIIDGLHRLFNKQGIDIACREDVPQSLYELSIDHKPWANPKSVFTEKLLLDIFTLVYQAGYTFLSCIDYGREPDDRIAMAFSKPSTPTPSPNPGSRAGTPLPPTGSPLLNGSHLSIPEQPKARPRMPFALSFSSTTVMRVISPPLHLTPAILQAVRGSWPRGVVSEKKVGENCFEFKLKGYKWFQQDNFATDSLQHILSLLSSLDAHSFTLLTSLSLTNRSRVKDLWIFTGPAAPGSDNLNEETSLHGNSRDHSLELRRPTGEAAETSRSNQHRRLATETSLTPPQPMASHHSRSATEDMSQRHQQNNGLATPPHQPHLLRKPAPRAQVPVSVAHESESEEEDNGYARGRVNLPSMISSTSPNMTGIGAAGQGPDKPYSFGPFNADSQHGGAPFVPQDHQYSPSETSTIQAPSSYFPPTTPHGTAFPQPLLSPGTFRDSVLSSQSDVSQNISIKWTGAGREDGALLSKPVSGSVTTPKFPGGWQGTPMDEIQESEAAIFPQPETPKARTPIYETMSRVESPEIVQPNVSLRKSEAVVFGMISATSPSPPPPIPSSPLSVPPRSPAILPEDRIPSKKSEKSSRGEGSSSHGGQGWVLVNVEGTPTPRLPIAEAHLGSSSKSTPAGEASSSSKSPNVSNSPTPPPEPSHAAKAIVIVDAIESKHKKSKSTSATKEAGEGGGVRRFFSLNRKNSKKVRAGEGGQVVMERESTVSESQQAQTTVSRSTLRDRIRILGTPEATRREDKPRDLD